VLWKVIVAAFVAAIFIGGCSPSFNAVFHVFPIPYFPISSGALAVAVSASVTIALQSKSVLKDPVMRRRFKWALLLAILNIGSGFLYAFYVGLFVYAQGLLQSLVAPILRVVKIGVKAMAMFLAHKVDNPDFMHGSALFTDVAGTCITAIVFININSVESFLVLLAVDTGTRLQRSLEIIAQASLIERQKNERIIRGLCTRRDVASCKAATVQLDELTMSPHLVRLCGELFFTQLTEFVVPAIMGLCSLVVYYLPSCNRLWVRYMYQNTEEQFLTGMGYLLLDCATQLLLFFASSWYLKFKAGVPITHLGFAIMNQEKLCYTLVVVGLVLFFFLLFVDHAGVDPTFKFAWLHPGYKGDSVVRLCPPCD